MSWEMDIYRELAAAACPRSKGLIAIPSHIQELTATAEVSRAKHTSTLAGQGSGEAAL
jgi:hypothetical protein